MTAAVLGLGSLALGFGGSTRALQIPRSKPQDLKPKTHDLPLNFSRGAADSNDRQILTIMRPGWRSFPARPGEACLKFAISRSKS